MPLLATCRELCVCHLDIVSVILAAWSSNASARTLAPSSRSSITSSGAPNTAARIGRGGCRQAQGTARRKGRRDGRHHPGHGGHAGPRAPLRGHAADAGTRAYRQPVQGVESRMSCARSSPTLSAACRRFGAVPITWAASGTSPTPRCAATSRARSEAGASRCASPSSSGSTPPASSPRPWTARLRRHKGFTTPPWSNGASPGNAAGSRSVTTPRPATSRTCAAAAPARPPTTAPARTSSGASTRRSGRSSAASSPAASRASRASSRGSATTPSRFRPTATAAASGQAASSICKPLAKSVSSGTAKSPARSRP